MDQDFIVHFAAVNNSDQTICSRHKGIVDFANEFHIFGIRAFYVGILIQCFRERRVWELVVTGFRSVLYWANPVTIPRQTTHLRQFQEVHERLPIGDSTHLIARRQAVSRENGLLIAGEYGKPGARLLVVSQGTGQVYQPFQGDTGVQHIHAIANLKGPYYLISTGDTSKRLDVLRISDNECTLTKTIFSSLAGFTAISVVDDEIWLGSDFSERVNFIARLSSNLDLCFTYYLPRNCVREFVISISPYGQHELLVITARLNQSYGHALIFCRKNNEFVSANRIEIDEIIIDAAL